MKYVVILLLLISGSSAYAQRNLEAELDSTPMLYDKIQFNSKFGFMSNSFSKEFGWTFSSYQTFRADINVRWNGLKIGAEKSYVLQSYKLPGNFFRGYVDVEKRFRRITLGATASFFLLDTAWTWGKTMNTHSFIGSIRTRFVLLGDPSLNPRLWVEATGRYVHFGNNNLKGLRGWNVSLDVAYRCKAGELHAFCYGNPGEDNGVLGTQKGGGVLLQYKTPKIEICSIAGKAIAVEGEIIGGSWFRREYNNPLDGKLKTKGLAKGELPYNTGVVPVGAQAGFVTVGLNVIIPYRTTY